MIHTDHISPPQSGQRIKAEWGRAITAAITARGVTSVAGGMVSRTPQGTTASTIRRSTHILTDTEFTRGFDYRSELDNESYQASLTLGEYGYQLCNFEDIGGAECVRGTLGDFFKVDLETGDIVPKKEEAKFYDFILRKTNGKRFGDKGVKWPVHTPKEVTYLYFGRVGEQPGGEEFYPYPPELWICGHPGNGEPGAPLDDDNPDGDKHPGDDPGSGDHPGGDVSPPCSGDGPPPTNHPPPITPQPTI